MRLPRVFLFLFLFFALSVPAQARDKIGLVLSGGGAKGSAHIGVLKVLEKNNIPVDYIVGTSIGAYVAGMYALGYEIEEIETIMLGLPWDNGFSDFVPRESLLFDDKQLRDKYNLSIRLGYENGEFKVPPGLLLGQSAYQILQRSTDTVSSFVSFDDLAIPYRAVASDIATAQAVVLASGSVNEAMKASAAVPGIVAAVEIDGRMLVDGGITNNMPIDVIKKMGADIVIAVDIGSPLSSQSELTSTVSVLNQLSTILTNNTSLAQKALMTEKDVLLRPEIGELSTTDWSIMPQALVLGEQEAQANIAKLATLSINPEDYLAYQNAKRSKATQWFKNLPNKIVEIKLKNDSKVDKDIITKYFAIELGQSLTKEQLDEAIDRVYALDHFEQVTVEFQDTPQGRVLTLNTQAKSWGPNYFNFGFNLKTDFANRSVTSIDMAYRLTDITANGGEWLNEVNIGWENGFATEFYQPLNKTQEFYARARAEYAQDKWDKSELRSYQLNNEYYQAITATGYNYSDEGIIEVGAIAQMGELSIDSVTVDEFDYESYGGFATLAYDTLDSINFPTQGNKLTLEVFYRNDKYSPLLVPTEYDTSVEVTLDWRGAIDFRGHTFVGITSFATVDNETEFSAHVTELGGFLNLSGYQEDALIGVHKAFAAIVYQYDLGRDIPGAGLPIYLGTSLEAGNIWGINETVRFSDLINSGSIYLGTDTSFGPAVFGIGFATGGEYSLFLSIGKNW